MKSFVISLWATLMGLWSYGQFNIPVTGDDMYCSRMTSEASRLMEYSAPVTQNPLLDKYDVHFYFLDLNVENNTVYLSGNVTIGATAVSVLDTFAFELIDAMTVESVKINGSELPFTHGGDMGLVPLPVPVAAGSDFTAQVYYYGTPPSGGFFSGINTEYSSQWGKDVTWTLSEPYAAKDWWPTKQDLTDKADSAWIFLTTSNENLAGSQGLLTNVVPVDGNKLRFEWKTYYPIDYYLISFAVADYQEYNIYAYPSAGPDSLLIQNFIYDSPGCLNYYQSGIDQTAAFIELYSELFGMYPFPDEKYGHCLTELGGGMEHQTMTTIGGFSFSLVAHELGHMWFGDNITCAAWNDIWINEGFATYSDYLAHHFLAGEYYDSLWLKIRHDQVKSQPGGSVYVPDEDLDDVWRIFDGRLSYSKGALLLHMIRFELQNDSLFYDILTQFGVEYGDSVATGLDFKALVEAMSGMDFTDFFDQWYFGEGYPIFDIIWHQEGTDLYLTSYQTTSTIITPLFKMTVPYHLLFEDGSDTTILLYQSDNMNEYVVPAGKMIDQIKVDPKQWILHRLNSLTVVVEEYDNPVHYALAPNPAGDQVSLFFTHLAGQSPLIRISDITGRQVFSSRVSSDRTDISLKSLRKGVYLVTVSDGIHSFTRKLVKE